MDKAGEIAALLAPTVRALGLELLGAEYLPAPGGAVLRLYIDVPEAEAGERNVGIEGLRTREPRGFGAGSTSRIRSAATTRWKCRRRGWNARCSAPRSSRASPARPRRSR